MAYSKKLNLIFIHVPKCAGTSVIEAMRKIDPSTDHGHKPWTEYDTYEINIKSPASFTIVRNPWDRVFSCYNYARKSESYWHGQNKQYGVHPDHELLKKYDFKDCVKMLYYNRELLDKPANLRPNFKHNWDHQHKYIFDKDGKPKVDHILRFEFMDEITDWLKSVHNLDLPELNISTKGQDYKDHYDDEMIDLVSQIYNMDIKLLKYVF